MVRTRSSRKFSGRRPLDFDNMSEKRRIKPAWTSEIWCPRKSEWSLQSFQSDVEQAQRRARRYSSYRLYRRQSILACVSPLAYKNLKRVAIAVVVISISACGIANPPIEYTPQVVPAPAQGVVSVAVNRAPAVGQVIPVNVSVADGTDFTRSVIPSQIFAINEIGERVAPLPPGEAARQAGSAGELKAALESVAISGAAGGAVGAGLGAGVGAVTRGVGPGAIIGTAFGAGWGIFSGAGRGQDRADQQASAQLGSLALPQQDVAHNFTVSGYVFFPKGDYQQIQVLMTNRETNDTEIITRPWL